MNQEFGPRLRQERERRRISLDSIAATTKVGIALFEGLERDDVSRWPTGIFRRSFVRAYASAIGLDADEVVKEFLERFPDPDTTPNESTGSGRGEPGADAARTARLRLRIADMAWAFTAGHLLSASRGRWAAILVDAGVIVATGVLLFLFLGAFWMPFALFTVCYYWGSILVVGNTPGVCLMAQPPAATSSASSASRPPFISADSRARS